MMRNVRYAGLCGVTLYLLLLLVIVLAACSGNGQRRVGENVGTAKDDTTRTSLEEQAGYSIAHFWDGMDFTDTVRSHDRLFMEQNFVKFISLFPYAEQEVLSLSIYRLQERAKADSVAFRLVNDIAEHYLANPNSPMRNEEYYIFFLEGKLRFPGVSEEDSIRTAYQLKTAKKNRPGAKATNFAYTDRNGMRRTLLGTQAKRLLLLFYDPACSHCSEILEELRESALLSDLMARQELTVLAVYTEGDRKLWNETKATMPPEWIVSIDESHIVDRSLYDLPAMPILYLLDEAKTVLLKDPTLARLEEYLADR